MVGTDVPQFLGLLVVTLAAAKLFGLAAQWAGQARTRNSVKAR
jgi:hypothetical protein